MRDFRQATVIRLGDVQPLVEALRFYADAENYVASNETIGLCEIYLSSQIEIDKGEIARTALLKQPQVRIVTAEIDA